MYSDGVPTLELTPDRIVTVARSLIREHGLSGFSMRKLAAALDVNPMTIYLRFDNKDALLARSPGRAWRSSRHHRRTARGANRCGRSPSDSGTT